MPRGVPAPTATFVCRHCKQTRAISQALLDSGKHAGQFCDSRCRGDYRRAHAASRPLCKRCGSVVSSSSKRLCLNCHVETTRTRIERTCARAGCGKTFEITPGRLTKGRGKWCSKTCQYPDSPTATCQRCGESFSLKGRAPDAKFCDRDCRWGPRLMRRCPCGAEFHPKPAIVARGYGNFCCRAHGYLYRRRGHDVECATCRTLFYVEPGRPRRYCSWACVKRKVERRCALCNRSSMVSPSVVQRGARDGSYRHRACTRDARRQALVGHVCACGCRRALPAPARHYWSSACFHRARGLTHRHRVACRVCKQPFTTPNWQKARRFCSDCWADRSAYRQRRPRTSSSAVQVRDRRILGLHQRGLTSTLIARELTAQPIAGLARQPTAAVVRQVIHRKQK